jgi:tetratricopeptide (TPR) repeat protein
MRSCVFHAITLRCCALFLCIGAPTAFAATEAPPFRAGLQLSPDMEAITRPRLTMPAATPTATPRSSQQLQRSLRRIQELMDAGRFELALLELEIELEGLNDDPRLLDTAVQAAFRAGRTDEAGAYLERLMARTDEILPALPVWTLALVTEERLREAGDVVREMRTRQPYHRDSILAGLAYAALTDQPRRETIARLQLLQIGDIRNFLQALLQDNGSWQPVLPEDTVARLIHNLLTGEPAPDQLDIAATRASGQLALAFLNRLEPLMLAQRWGAIVQVGTRREVAERIGLTNPAYRAYIAYAQARAGDVGAAAELIEINSRYPDHLAPELMRFFGRHDQQTAAQNRERLLAIATDYPGEPVVQIMLQAQADADEPAQDTDIAEPVDLPAAAGWLLSDPLFQSTLSEMAQADAQASNLWMQIVNTQLVEFDRAMQRQDLTRAGLVIRRALQWAPLDDRLIYRGGQIATLQDRLDEAIRYFDRLATVYPDNTFALALYGGALIRQGRHQEATDILERGYAINPYDINLRFQNALHDVIVNGDPTGGGHLRYLEIGEYGQSIAWLAQELPLFRRLMGDDLLRQFAGYLVTGGYTAEADADDTDWAAANDIPQLTDDTRDLASYLATLSRGIRAYMDAKADAAWGAAETTLSQLKRYGARSPVIGLERADVWLHEELLERVGRQLQGLAQNPDTDPELLIRYGFLLLDHDQPDIAGPLFERILEQHKNHIGARFGLACARTAASQFGESIELYRQLIWDAPDTMAAWEHPDHPYHPYLARFFPIR